MSDITYNVASYMYLKVWPGPHLPCVQCTCKSILLISPFTLSLSLSLSLSRSRSRHGAVRYESVMKLRNKLEELGKMKGVNQDEKGSDDIVPRNHL